MYLASAACCCLQYCVCQLGCYNNTLGYMKVITSGGEEFGQRVQEFGQIFVLEFGKDMFEVYGKE